MKRKIAMFVSTWFADQTTELINGILDVISGLDLEIHLFNTYNVTEKVDIIPKEQDILSLPYIGSYDGVLIMYNSVGSYPELEDLSKRCNTLNIPVLCIDQSFGNQPFIGVDNYRSFYQVVEHMISVHNCKTLNFLGGPEDHPENMLRLQAYKDCLTAHNIPIDPDRILFFNFLHSDGERAYNQWKQNNLHLPDVVICASDNMALGYCVSAEDDGYYVPEDIKVTGFDNLEDGQHYIPSITSVNRSWKRLGQESVRKLLQRLDGIPIPKEYNIKGELIINESCGCHNATPLQDAILTNFRARKKRDRLGTWSRRALQIMCNAESEDDIREGLRIGEIKVDLVDLTLCLNHSAQTLTKDTPLTDYIDNFHVISKDGYGSVSRNTLLPDNLKKPDCKVFVFSPLHFGNHNFGYSVIPYTDNLFQYDKHRKFIDYLCLSLECTTQREFLRQTNKQLENLYLQDQLTGLYNRFGYTDLSPAFFDSHSGQLSIFYIDLDNLKQTNDIHGHAMGDKSLCAVADGMRACFSSDSLKIRMGGDEFLVIEGLLSDETAIERQNRMAEFLTHYQHREALPITLTASIGYLKSTDQNADLEKLIREADQNMYRNKQAKKQQSMQAI